MTKTKTHWLQNPNKNYLGHWDLPGGNPVLLTIKSAGWEPVKNPIINTTEAKRVIRFEENHKWLKPFICNQTNAQSILKSTKQSYMEDCRGCVIKLEVALARVKGEEVDCIRVSSSPQTKAMAKTINKDQAATLEGLIKGADIDHAKWCKTVRVNNINEVLASKYEGYVKRLNEIIDENRAKVEAEPEGVDWDDVKRNSR